jgi:molybdate transport system ATP-binding protein
MNNVNVQYGQVRLLHEVSWTIRSGEHWAVLGPNGSGKTTLLSLLLGDNLQVYANDIVHFGKRLGENLSLWNLRKQLALISPDLQVHYPHENTGWEVVASGLADSIGLYERVGARRRQKVDAALVSLGLASLSNQCFGQLSAGEQRLLLLARALVKNPRLLILDEPCQGLDTGNRRKLLQAVQAIGGTGETGLIFVTHYPEEIPRCTTHLLELRRGRVARQGPFTPRQSLIA